jgi:predicted metallopeptidase
MRKFAKGRRCTRFNWRVAPDVKRRVISLLGVLGIDWIAPERIFCYRSEGSKSRAYARTWGLAKIWQDALGVKPAYIIEVISKYFDHLPPDDQDKILLHEVTHIPKNFSGALLPHTRRGKRSFYKKVDELIGLYWRNISK